MVTAAPSNTSFQKYSPPGKNNPCIREQQRLQTVAKAIERISASNSARIVQQYNNAVDSYNQTAGQHNFQCPDYPVPILKKKSLGPQPVE